MGFYEINDDDFLVLRSFPWAGRFTQKSYSSFNSLISLCNLLYYSIQSIAYFFHHDSSSSYYSSGSSYCSSSSSFCSSESSYYPFILLSSSLTTVTLHKLLQHQRITTQQKGYITIQQSMTSLFHKNYSHITIL